MYVIRLLLDNGYSKMAVRSFFEEYDGGGYTMLCIEADGGKTAMQYNAAGFMQLYLAIVWSPIIFRNPQET